MLVLQNCMLVAGPRREPVFFHASARDVPDAHCMRRSGSLAHVRWSAGSYWKHFVGIYPRALRYISS